MNAAEAKAKEVLSTRETASFLDVSSRTIGRMAKKGILKAYVLNSKKYFKYSEIIKAMEAGKEKQAA